MLQYSYRKSLPAFLFLYIEGMVITLRFEDYLRTLKHLIFSSVTGDLEYVIGQVVDTNFPYIDKRKYYSLLYIDRGRKDYSITITLYREKERQT